MAQPTVVSTAISSAVRDIFKCEGISIAPNGTEVGTLDSRGLSLTSTGTLAFGSFGSISAASDGVFTLLNNAGTNFTRLNLGGTSASFPALASPGSGILAIITASASANATVRFGALQLKTGILLMSGTAPTISSAFGTSPSIATENGSSAFTINVGTGGVATGGVIGVPAASNGWIASVKNLTALAANRGDQQTVQTASTTTTITVQNQTVSTGAALAWTASDILLVTAMAY